MFNNKKIKMKKNRSLLFLAVFGLVFGPLAGAQASQAPKKAVFVMSNPPIRQAPKENPGGDGGQQDAMGNPSSIQILDMEKMPVQQAQEENTPSSDDDDAKSTGSKWSTLAQDNLKVSPTQDFPSIQPVPQAQEESKGPASLEIVVKQPQQRETKPQEEDENYRKAGFQEEEKGLAGCSKSLDDDTCSMMSGGVANNSANSPRSALAQNGSIASLKNRAPVLKDEARIEPRVYQGEECSFGLVLSKGRVFFTTKNSVQIPGEKRIHFFFQVPPFTVNSSSADDPATQRLKTNPDWQRAQSLFKVVEKTADRVFKEWGKVLYRNLFALFIHIYQNSENKNELSDFLRQSNPLDLEPGNRVNDTTRYYTFFMKFNSGIIDYKNKKVLRNVLFFNFDKKENAFYIMKCLNLGFLLDDCREGFGTYALASGIHYFMRGGKAEGVLEFMMKIRHWQESETRIKDLQDPRLFQKMRPCLMVFGQMVKSMIEEAGSSKNIDFFKKCLLVMEPMADTYGVVTRLLDYAEGLKKTFAEILFLEERLHKDYKMTQDRILELIGTIVMVSTHGDQWFSKGNHKTPWGYYREYEQFRANRDKGQVFDQDKRHDGYYAMMELLDELSRKKVVVDPDNLFFKMVHVVRNGYQNQLGLFLDPDSQNLKSMLNAKGGLFRERLAPIFFHYVFKELDQRTQPVCVDDIASLTSDTVSIIDDKVENLNDLDQSDRFSMASYKKGSNKSHVEPIVDQGFDKGKQYSEVSDIQIENSDTFSIIGDEAQDLNALDKEIQYSKTTNQYSNTADIDLKGIDAEFSIYTYTENVIEGAVRRFIKAWEPLP
jgi:hypothetical protein